jgi:agmatine deiminase
MSAVPAELGFRMPAEWEPHEATWIAWPHQRRDWPGKFATIPWVYAEIVRHLHQAESVCILVDNRRGEKDARAVLRKLPLDWERIQFWRIPTDRVWTRDYGPIFVTGPDGQVGFLDWRFNGWAKYANHRRDDDVPRRIARKLPLPNWRPEVAGVRMVLEGGSIDVNGVGCLLTTEECLLSDVQARNPSLTVQDYERAFADFLGIRKVLWLGRGLAGDDTHGHVDDLARFVAA